MSRWLAVLAVLAAALTAGRLGAGAVSGVEVAAGEVTVTDGVATLSPRARVGLGTGTSVALHGAFPGEVDVYFGHPQDPTVAIAHLGRGSGLLTGTLSPLGDNPRWPWTPGEVTVELRCGGTLTLLVDGTPAGSAPAEPRCPPRPFFLKAAAGGTLDTVTVDGRPVGMRQAALAAGPALAAGAAAAVAAWLWGPATLAVLLAAPLALVAPRVGLDGRAALAALAATVAFQAAWAHAGWRRWLGAAAAAAALLGAAAVVLRPAAGPVVGDAEPSPVVSQAARTVVDAGTARAKVDIVLQRVRPLLAQRPTDRPLVVTLGSSSSGGGTPGTFWPQVLAAEVPEVHVVSAAEGGATSWHMRKVLEGLEVTPDLCVAYLGHNDTLASFPGLTLAQLERGDTATSADWVPPVTREEAAENFAAMVGRCRVFVAMQEYSRGREPTLASYAELLRGVPGVRVLDGAAVLAAAPASTTMIDDVHPSPQGQQLLGRFVAAEVRRLLPELRGR